METSQELVDSRWIDNDEINYEIQKKKIVHKKFLQVTEWQKDLWLNHTLPKEVYDLWFTQFNTQDRMRLWNSLDFPFEYFKILTTQMKWSRQFKKECKKVVNNENVYNYGNLLKLLNYTEMKYLAEIIIEGEIGKQTRTDELMDINDKFDQFKYISKHVDNLNDNKSSLWIPLSVEDKFRLFINQRNLRESQLMQMLM